MECARYTHASGLPGHVASAQGHSNSNQPAQQAPALAQSCGPGRRSISVIFGHACEMLAVMYLQRGPPIAENETTTHRTHSIERRFLVVIKLAH